MKSLFSELLSSENLTLISLSATQPFHDSPQKRGNISEENHRRVTCQLLILGSPHFFPKCTNLLSVTDLIFSCADHGAEPVLLLVVSGAE